MNYSRLNILGGISVLESIADTYQYAPHWHEKYVVAIYRGGAKQFKCGQHQGIAKPDDLLIIAPGTVHSAVTFDRVGWDYCSLYLSSEQLSKATGIEDEVLLSKIQNFSQLSCRPKLAHKAFQAFDAGIETDIALCEWLIDLLGSISGNLNLPDHIPPYLVRVYERILDDPTKPITMGDLSALACVTPEHLSRSFKQAYGLSPFQLLIAARIETARRLSAEGTPLAIAAISAGFSDQSHMTRWFKRSFGVSPSVFLRYQ